MMSLLVVTTPELGRVFSYVYCFSAHKVIAYKSCLEHIMAGKQNFFSNIICASFINMYKHNATQNSYEKYKKFMKPKPAS